MPLRCVDSELRCGLPVSILCGEGGSWERNVPVCVCFYVNDAGWVFTLCGLILDRRI